MQGAAAWAKRKPKQGRKRAEGGKGGTQPAEAADARARRTQTASAQDRDQEHAQRGEAAQNRRKEQSSGYNTETGAENVRRTTLADAQAAVGAGEGEDAPPRRLAQSRHHVGNPTVVFQAGGVSRDGS